MELWVVSSKDCCGAHEHDTQSTWGWEGLGLKEPQGILPKMQLSLWSSGGLEGVNLGKVIIGCAFLSEQVVCFLHCYLQSEGTEILVRDPPVCWGRAGILPQALDLSSISLPPAPRHIISRTVKNAPSHSWMRTPPLHQGDRGPSLVEEFSLKMHSGMT